MQVKDILKLQLTDEIAIIRGYVHASRRTPDTIREPDVAKVTLVNFDKYQDYGYAFLPADSANILKPAPAGAKVYAFLVQSVTPTGTTYYLAKPKEFVGLWAPLQTRWTNEQAQATNAEAIRLHRRAISEPVVTRINEQRIETGEAVKKTHLTMFGAELTRQVSLYTDVQVDWVETGNDPMQAKLQTKIAGDVRLPYDLFMSLLEEAMANKYDE